MIQLIKNLWIKWKYRKYFNCAKNQTEYYNELLKAAHKAYLEFNKPENIGKGNAYIPIELLGNYIPDEERPVSIPDLMHALVKIKEIYIKEDKIK